MVATEQTGTMQQQGPTNESTKALESIESTSKVEPLAAAESTAPTSASSATAGPSSRAALSREGLEEEVGQVLGTLSSWWGGVKKQSVTALSGLKADLDKTVVQAQADFEQLRVAKVEVIRKDPEQYAAEQKAERERRLEQDPDSILNRITNSTTQIQQNLQSTLQSTIAAAKPALANASETFHLSAAKQNLQSSMTQAEKLAEEYLSKGDQLRKDAERWMSEAVKVVPPGEQAAGGEGMRWDGSDWYAIATTPASKAPKSPSQPSRPLAGSRKDALLARLREDEELVLVDPLASDVPAEQRERFERWVADKWPAVSESGIAAEGAMVGTVRMSVVPERMTDDQFWQRYLYIRDTIFEEDEKRQELLKATEVSAQPDDFTWDDEPEEPSRTPTHVEVLPVEAPLVMPSTTTSPRNSSEESYDVVSDQTAKLDTPKEVRVKGGDDEDSDWE